MADKGFLVRGTLRLNMASIVAQPKSLADASGKVQLPQNPNRVPPSISLKRTPTGR